MVASNKLTTTIGQLVTERPIRAKIFESFGIDYCCGGKKPLAQACAERKLDPKVVVGILDAFDDSTAARAGQEPDWSKASVSELADHLGFGAFDLVGYSMGGVTAVLVATRDPRIRRLVIGGIGSAVVELGGVDTRVMDRTALAAVLMRQTRNSMIEVLSADYIRTAYSKGLARPAVVFRHAIRNGLIPVITIFGLQMGALISGAVVTEQIFVVPGFGRLIVEAVFTRDYPLVQGVVLITASAYVLINLLVDLSYSLLNPRIRVGGGAGAA